MPLRDRIRRVPAPVRWTVAAVLLLALLLAGVHLPPVRGLLLARAIRAIQADGRLIVRARSLDYNLFAGAVTLTDVAVASRATPSQPFVTADRIALVVPWGAVFGPLRLDAVALDGLRIAVVRDADGRTNLPASAVSVGEPAAIPIGRLEVAGASISYADAAADVDAAVGATITLHPDRGVARGTLALSQPGTLRVGDRRTRVTMLTSRIAWDGRMLMLEEAALAAPEGRLHAAGTVGVLTRDAALALDARATLALPALSPWMAIEPALRGEAALEARITGSLDAPTVRASLATRDAGWRDLDGVAADATVSATPQRIVVERAAMALARGRIEASGQIDLGEDAPRVDGTVSFTDLDLGELSRAAGASASSLRPAAMLGGRAHVDGDATDPARLTAEVDLVLREGRATRNALPIGGVVRASLGDGRWRADLRGRAVTAAVRATAAGDLRAAALKGSPYSRSDFRGSAVIAVASFGDLARALSRSGIVVPANVAGHGELTIAARGTLADPALEATLDVPDLRAGDVGPAIVAARARGTLDALRLAGTSVALGDNRVDLTGTVAPRLGRLDLHAAGTLSDLARLAPMIPADLRPTGTVMLDAHVRGTFGAPRVTAVVEGIALAAAGQRFDTLLLRGSLAGPALIVDRLEATQPGGALSARGEYDLRRDRFRVVLDARGLALAPLPPRLIAERVTARIDARFEGGGTRRDPAGQGTIALRDIRAGGERIGDVLGTIGVAERTATLDLQSPEWQARAEGRVGLDAPHAIDVTAAFLETDLVRALRLVPGAPPNVSGTSTITLRATGDADRPQAIEAAVGIERVNAQVGDVRVQVHQPARATYHNESLAIDRLIAAIGGGSTVDVSGVVGRPADAGLRLRVDARSEDLLALASAFGAVPSDLSASGPVRVDALVAGTPDRLTITGTACVADARVTSGTLPELRIAALDAAFDPSRLTIGTLSAAWQDASLTGSASLPLALLAGYLPAALQPGPRVPSPAITKPKLGTGLISAGGTEYRPVPNSSEREIRPVPNFGFVIAGERAHLELRVTNIGPEAARPFLDEASLARLGGRLSLSAAFDADALALDRVTGHVQLDDLDVTVAELPVRQDGPTRIDVANGFARVSHWAWAGEAVDLRVDGQVRLADRMSGLIATGAVDLRLLTPFLADAGVSTGGRLQPRLVITGPLDEAKIDGDLTLTGGELVTRDPAVAAADVTARAVLSRNRLDLLSMTGTLNGGTLSGRGGITLRDFVPVEGRVVFTGRGLALDIPRGLQSEADGDLTVTYADAALALDGSVRVLRGAYREPLALAAGLLAALRAPVVTTGAAAPPSLVDSATLDIAVATAEDVHVDNNYGRFDLGADLRLVGTVAEPALVGRVTVREGGQILFGGRTYNVEQPGFIDFSNPFRIEPDISLAATTRVGRCGITLTLAGTPEDLTTDLSGDAECPSTNQADLVSLLLTGRTADQAGGIQAQVAGEQLVGLLSGELLGMAGRAIGLDRLELGSAPQSTYALDPGRIAMEANPGSRLTFGKSLGTDVDVTFSQSLRQSGGLIWIIAYTPLRQLELRLVSNGDISRSYEFRHDLQFGRARVMLPAAIDARAPAVPRAAPPTVASVQMTGADAAGQRALERRLSLRAGKRFDFEAWRRDRERIAAYYQERGFREVRVGARREEDHAGRAGGAERAETIVLEYAIDRGPETRLDVQGFRLSRDVTARVYEAWANGVFDTFRADGMAAVVRDALVRDGYLEPRVTVTFVRGAAESTTAPTTSTTTTTTTKNTEKNTERARAEVERGAVKTAHVIVEPGVRVRQRTVRIAGVDEEQRARLEAWIEDQNLGDAAFEDPRRVESALIAHLRDQGHLAAVVRAAKPLLEGEHGTVVVQVDPGPVYHVSALRVNAPRPGPARTATDPALLREDAVYTPGALVATRAAVEAAWRGAGFPSVKVGVETAIDAARAQVAVTFTVDPGPRQVLEAVVVSGADDTRPALVSRTLDLPLHEPVSTAALFQARKRLAETGIFRRVDVTTEPAGPVTGEGDQPVRARVVAEEWPRYRLQYGFRGLDHEPDGPGTGRTLTPGLAADFTRRNLWGLGMTTGASLRVQAREREARGFWSAPSLAGLPITSTVFVSRGRLEAAPEAGGFVTNESIVTAEQRFRLPRNARVLYSYNLGSSVVSGEIFGESFSARQRVARLNSSLLVDTRDNPEDTRRGWFHSSTIEYASSRLGSELAFAKYVAQQYYFRPIGSMVLASAGRIGLAAPLANQVLILSERFFAGGGRTVRGYADDGLGPRDALGFAAGGNALVVLNQELRFPVYRWIGGVSFVDAGNVFATIGDLSLTDLAVGTGVGLRIQTPVVLLRADYGFPLRGTNRQGKWIFSIGQTF